MDDFSQSSPLALQPSFAILPDQKIINEDNESKENAADYDSKSNQGLVNCQSSSGEGSVDRNWRISEKPEQDPESTESAAASENEVVNELGQTNAKGMKQA